MRSPNVRAVRLLAVPLLAVLLLAACTTATSSATASPTPEPTTSPTSTPEPTPTPDPSLGSSEAAEAYIAAETGYETVDLPAQLQDQITQQFASDRNVSRIARGFAVANATRGGQSVGIVLVLDVERSWAVLPGFEEGFVQGIGESAGARPETLTLSGRSAYLFEGSEFTGVAWVDGTILAFAFGTAAEPLTSLAKALIRANA